jgi:ATP-dependent DNA ligase
VALKVAPPLKPMLAKLTRQLPDGDFVYEPKWDGFRCIAFVERLARETPAAFVAFDLIAAGDDDLRELPFTERRARLEHALRDAREPISVTPATEDPVRAREWLDSFVGNGIDGVIAKPKSEAYRPGARALLKVKHERTADCVVAGFRSFVGGRAIGSLLLGLYDDEGLLRHVGVAASFGASRHDEIASEVMPRIAPLAGHPWEQGFLEGPNPAGRLAGAAGRWSPDMELDWNPIAPLLVCEVAYDQVDAHRFRHPARFRRWRPDREARSCTLDQLDVDAPRPADVLAGT